MLFLPGLAVGQQDFRPGPQVDIDTQSDQKAHDSENEPTRLVQMRRVLDCELEDQHQRLDRNCDQDRRDEPRERPPGRAVASDVLPEENLFLEDGFRQIEDRQRQGQKNRRLKRRGGVGDFSQISEDLLERMKSLDRGSGFGRGVAGRCEREHLFGNLQ